MIRLGGEATKSSLPEVAHAFWSHPGSAWNMKRLRKGLLNMTFWFTLVTSDHIWEVLRGPWATNLIVHRIWYPQGILKQIPHRYQGPTVHVLKFSQVERGKQLIFPHPYKTGQESYLRKGMMHFQMGQRICYWLSNSTQYPNDEKHDPKNDPNDLHDPETYNLRYLLHNIGALRNVTAPGSHFGGPLYLDWSHLFCFHPPPPPINAPVVFISVLRKLWFWEENTSFLNRFVKKHNRKGAWHI